VCPKKGINPTSYCGDGIGTIKPTLGRGMDPYRDSMQSPNVSRLGIGWALDDWGIYVPPIYALFLSLYNSRSIFAPVIKRQSTYLRTCPIQNNHLGDKICSPMFTRAWQRIEFFIVQTLTLNIKTWEKNTILLVMFNGYILFILFPDDVKLGNQREIDATSRPVLQPKIIGLAVPSSYRCDSWYTN